jgi:hypothetical protein
LGWKVHGWVASSISKVTLGGTQVGWMGETSVPRTVVEGKASAKSLGVGG